MEQVQFKRLNGKSMKQIIQRTRLKTKLQPGSPLLVEENGIPDEFSVQDESTDST